MKKLLLSFSVLVFVYLNCLSQTSKPLHSLTGGTQNNTAAIPEDWASEAQQYIVQSGYFFSNVCGNYLATNNRQNLAYYISARNMTIRPAQAVKGFCSSSLSLTGINKGANDILQGKEISHTQKENDLSYEFGAYRIEYHNDGAGLRQNFIIENAPLGHAPLQLKLSVEGDLKPSVANGHELCMTDEQSAKGTLHYDGLAVWDARHKKLDARMEMQGNKNLLITVNDRDAVYPVTVDPLTHSSDWTASANGLLTSLLTNQQLKIDALFGYRVVGLGDINADGYDDAAISAPGTIDILPGPVTLANVGAVFIYFGSDTGLSAIPSRVLRPNTPVANALFGFSVAAGNVKGDAKRDIIVGAPGDSYSAATGGNSSTANVTAGKVYVYDGADITDNILTTPASLFLNGSLYFSTGGLFGAGANINTNALFGFSVAVTEDMDHDGLGEIVVGSPGYADAALLLVRTGAAFVYRSGKISTNEEVRLDAPTLLNFPAGANLNGLLFGYSVDGAGDFNKDGIPDIIAGAPAGINLGLPGFLGGSAYVYYGDTVTFNHTIGTQLSAGGGLLSSSANLFGLKVKGLANDAGVRNGNIIVSSPVSNVLHNTLGLNVKAGAINIFKANPSPANVLTPDQQLSSPRGTSLVSILTGQTIDANILTGFSIDNTGDVNCDGYGDIIVGEPLSTGVGMIGTNAVGGAAYIFTGKPDGTYNTTPYWTLENNVSFDFGVNAGSLLGSGVAGVGHSKGPLQGVSIIAGGAGAALDYSTGIFNLGNTLNVTSDFVAGNNGLGKTYSFNFNTCSILAVNTVSFNVSQKDCDALLSWQTANADHLSHILVERSADGVHFSPIQMISKKDDGIYESRINQIGKVALYRLNYVQVNGSSVYSDIKSVSVDCNGHDRLAAYPTLFSGDVKIVYNTAGNKGKAMLNVIDVYGRKMISTNINITEEETQTVINGSNLPAGMYYMQVTGQNFKSNIVKIVKD